jgi:S-adenosylmethionine decarboxylase
LQGLGLEVEWLSYTRKDFLFPELQKYPHRSTDEEIAFLRKHFPDGHAHMLGPLTRDHWFVFTADRCERNPDDLTERTLNLMMYNIAPEAAACFTRDGLAERDPAAAELIRACPASPSQAQKDALCRELGDCVTRKLLLDKLLPGTTTQAWLFEPCGWSLNGGVSLGPPAPSASTPGRYKHPTDGSTVDISVPGSPSAATTEAQDSAYWTIHVTPEEHCSYVSFETNAPLCRHRALVKALLALFRPRRFTMTLYADTGGLHLMHTSVHDESGATLRVFPGLAYSRLDLCSTVFEGTYSVILGNYRMTDQAKASEAPAATSPAAAKFSEPLSPASESAQLSELVAASAAIAERDLGRFEPA